MTGKPFPSCVNDLSPDQAMQLGSHYIGRISTGFAGASHIVDKTPMNFQYIALILRILPRARIVHCKRDALETCLSIFRLPFDPSQSYAHDLRALGIFYGHYSRLMAHTERVLGSAVFPVDLDVLIDDPAQTVAALCKFAGLEFDEAMLRFHDAERVVRTPSAMQVREPLRRAATPWGDRFGKAAAPLIDMLGDSLQKL